MRGGFILTLHYNLKPCLSTKSCDSIPTVCVQYFPCSSDEGGGGVRRCGVPRVRGVGGAMSEDEFERDMDSELMGLLQTVASPDALAAVSVTSTSVSKGRDSLHISMIYMRIYYPICTCLYVYNYVHYTCTSSVASIYIHYVCKAHMLFYVLCFVQVKREAGNGEKER